MVAIIVHNEALLPEEGNASGIMIDTEYYKEIAEKVDSEEYFHDARNWYVHKYMSPVVDRSYFYLYMLIVLIMMYSFYQVLLSFYPLRPYKPIFITVGDQTQQYTSLISVGNRNDRREDPHPKIHGYLTSKFIEAYESYNFKDDFAWLKRNEKLLTNLSSPEVMAEYKGIMNTTNPASPLLEYGRNAIVNVTVQPETFYTRQRESLSSQDAKRYTAQVDFMLDVISVKGSERNHKRATIEYIYKPLYYNKENKDFSPFEFTVTSYASEFVE